MKKLQAEIINCKKCKTIRQIKTPFLGLGNLNAKVMFIAEKPGYQTSIVHGITLAGNVSGDFFMRCLEYIKLSINKIYITNIIKCQTLKNRPPIDTEITACRNYLNRELEIVKPEVIVLMGRTAVNYFFPSYSVLEWAGKDLCSIDKKTKFYVLPHPAWALRTGRSIKFKKLFEKIKEFV